MKTNPDAKEPFKYADAISALDSMSWLIAMNEVLESLHKIKT